MSNQPQSLAVTVIGENGTRIWGLSTTERTRRLARERGLAWREGAGGEGAVILVNAGYVFEPLLLDHLSGQPRTVLVMDGAPVLAHVEAADAARVSQAMQDGAALDPDGLRTIDYTADFVLADKTLRKRERPFLMPLNPTTVGAAERASYFGAYKGVTDLLTKYLWPEWALVLTRIAARIGVTPNMVTAVGALLCVLATILFWNGHYWLGMAAGLCFMVLDTVDGKLARCTITSSKWGNIFDHGIDLIHPPFWWWAWGVGLSAWGLGFTAAEFMVVMVAIVGGYVVQRLIEGVFMRRFGMHIHVWDKIDSDFRLITARRNPNMVILFFATLAGRPDIGLEAVAVWTVLSCIFHAVRLVQAMAGQSAGRRIESWLT
jgi:phosphatidylglycerophosphate synthase